LDGNSKEIPLNPDGFPVIDGKTFPQRFDPVLGVKTDDEGLCVAPSRYNPNTGLPMNSVYEQSSIIHPDDEIATNMDSNHKFPEIGKHVPGTGQFVSEEGKEVPDRYDAETGRPID
jgi:hypothetical protein